MYHTVNIINPTEMYLRTVYELIEENIIPIRARVSERMQQSIPTVSDKVNRMVLEDKLFVLNSDNIISFTERGKKLAIRLIRNHRLLECLLYNILKMKWETVHSQACTLEHVASDDMIFAIQELLKYPKWSPYGNPIPYDFENIITYANIGITLNQIIQQQQYTLPCKVKVKCLTEWIQYDKGLLTDLYGANILYNTAIIFDIYKDGQYILRNNEYEVIINKSILDYFYVCAI